MRPLQRVSDSSWIALGLFLMAFSCCSSVEERQDSTNKQFEEISSIKGTDWGSRPAQVNQEVTVSAARTGGGSGEPDDNRGATAGSGGSKVKNKGPNCFAVVYSPPAVDAETCTTVCMKLWKLYMKKYRECDDIDKCFYKDLKSPTSYLRFHTVVGLSTAVMTLRRCSFETRDQDAPLAQYQHEDIIITTHYGSNPAEWPIVCPNHTTVTILQALMKYTGESTAGHDVSCPPWDARADLDEECKSTWPYASNYCILTSKAWKKALHQNPCGRVRDLHVTLRYSCHLQVPKDWDACLLDNSQGKTHGGCKCPRGSVSCTVEQAEASLRWSRLLYWLEEPVVAAHFLVMVNEKLRLERNVPCTTSRILCKKPDPPGPLPGLSPVKSWKNRGPHCYQPLDKATAELCTFACNILWNKVEDTATSQSDPFGWFLDMWTKASFGEMTEFDSSVQTTLAACSFEERDLLAPARQYEFEEWDTRGEFRNPCGKGKALDFVQVLMGCPAVLSENRDIKDCNYLDKTSEAATECANMRTVVDGVCRLGNFENSREVCPNCPGDIVFLWRWNCDYEFAAPHKDFTCTIREPAEAGGVNPEANPCACQNRATPCSLDEAKADMSWTQNITKGTIQLLSEGFAYTSDLTGPHFKIMYPSQQLCSNRSTQVLCKESTIEKFPAPQLTCKPLVTLRV